MGLIADRVMPQLVIDEMLKIFGEERIAHPEHQPKVFDFQMKFAKYMVDVSNNIVPVKQEIIDLNQETK